MHLLHIDASILGANSVSRKLTGAVVEHLRKATPGLDVTYRDLAAEPLSHFSSEHLAARQGTELDSPTAEKDIAVSRTVLEEFLNADTVVIGAPMYNFTLPTQLKAWIDRIVVAGETFRYGATGAEGLAGKKRVIITITRGGFYDAASPSWAFEHLETYLRAVFGFIGVANPEIIIAEGLQVGPEQREKAMLSAVQTAHGLRAA